MFVLWNVTSMNIKQLRDIRFVRDGIWCFSLQWLLRRATQFLWYPILFTKVVDYANQ